MQVPKDVPGVEAYSDLSLLHVLAAQLAHLLQPQVLTIAARPRGLVAVHGAVVCGAWWYHQRQLRTWRW